jgi:hypothetical protein
MTRGYLFRPSSCRKRESFENIRLFDIVRSRGAWFRS